MNQELETYNAAEREAAIGARLLCQVHASRYAPTDFQAAVFAALHLALEQEAVHQGIKFRLLFGCEE